MNRTNFKKILLLVTVGITVLTLIPVAYGKQPSSSTRPIEDWLIGNPFGTGPGWVDPNTMLSQRYLGTVDDADGYDGYVIETMRKDKSILLTVSLNVYGMPFALRNLTARVLNPEYEWFFVGVMDYTFEAYIVLEKHVPGGDLLDWDYGPLVTDNKGNPAPLIVPFGHIPSGPRRPGDFLPAWWLLYWYYDVVGGHFGYENWISVGSGNYIAPGWYPGSGDPLFLPETADVNHHQQVITSWDLDVNDDDVYQWTQWSVPSGVFKDGGKLRQSPLLIPETWPYEDLIIS
jgi:hypothetical protein